MKKQELKRLILKYETMLDTLIVMDDYHGGEAKMLRTIITDLKEIAGELPTFESKLEEMRKYPHQDNHMD